MKLIIVESPTKARTLSRFLGKDYRIEASMGHVRDLPKSELGVDVAHGFTPRYIIPRAKSKQVTALKNMAKDADSIVLATDPDREGEAIAWHIAEILTHQQHTKKQTLERITFHEITKTAIEEALKHPTGIDVHLVDAQQARRVLDRLVGYTLSPILWKKLSKRWLSAGRVQSVCVRLIVEREREIEAFHTQEYLTIRGEFSRDLRAQLTAKNGETYERTNTYPLFDGTYTATSTSIVSQDQADTIISDMQAPFTVTASEKRTIHRSPQPPYTTSTLQQDAARQLYFSSKKTMQIAQKLYEEGLITYHRTDSVNLSEQFIHDARIHITQTHGTEYVPAKPRIYKTKSKVAQEAHEAIRPTNVPTETIEQQESGDFHKDHARLYALIWKRAIASQAVDAVFDATTIRLVSRNGYEFQTSGSVITFPGYLKISGKQAEDVLLPRVSVGETLELLHAQSEPHETNPPPRYTEASLIKTLEEKGIGRPSTYAPIISTIFDRQYVQKTEKKLEPTELGFAVTDFLVRYFPNIMELPFTAHLEDDLDRIATGEKQWQPLIKDFYDPFMKTVERTYEIAEKVKLKEESIHEFCPKCGHPLVVRMGRYGKFIACSDFPECTYTRQFGEKAGIACPVCGGDIIVKVSKRGKKFYGCSTYPKCTFAAWKKEDIKKTEHTPKEDTGDQ